MVGHGRLKIREQLALAHKDAAGIREDVTSTQGQIRVHHNIALDGEKDLTIGHDLNRIQSGIGRTGWLECRQEVLVATHNHAAIGEEVAMLDLAKSLAPNI